MKKILVCCLLSFVCCLSYAKVVDRIVAVVNNDVITEFDLDRAMSPRLAEVRRSATPDLTAKSIRLQVLGDMINQILMKQAVEKANIEVTDEDLSRAIANVLEKNHINIEILRAELAAKNISFDAYKEELKDQIRQAKFIQQNLASNVQVSNEDVESYEAGNKGVYNKNGTVHLAWIYFPLDEDPSTKEISKVVQKGRKITDKARKGEDFAKLSKKYEGGDQGTKTLGDLPTALASEVAQMEPGGVSDPIVTPRGVYIVKLLEKSADVAGGAGPKEKSGTEDVKQTIYNDRMEQELNNYTMKLRRKAYIDIRE